MFQAGFRYSGVIPWILLKIALENGHFQTVYTLKQTL